MLEHPLVVTEYAAAQFAYQVHLVHVLRGELLDQHHACQAGISKENIRKELLSSHSCDRTLVEAVRVPSWKGRLQPRLEKYYRLKVANGNNDAIAIEDDDKEFFASW